MKKKKESVVLANSPSQIEPVQTERELLCRFGKSFEFWHISPENSRPEQQQPEGCWYIPAHCRTEKSTM